MTSVLTLIIGHRVPPLPKVENKKVDHCKDVKLYKMREATRRKQEHLYPVTSPEALSSSVLFLLPV